MKSNRVIDRNESRRLDLESRIRLEARLTDELAAERAKIHPVPPEWSFDQYKARAPWKKALFDFLGPLEGKTILDVGCGYHPTPVYFARGGAAKVLACDVSRSAVQFQQQLAEASGVADRVAAFICPVERMPFSNESFDLVHAESTIHHVHLGLAGAEIARVLKKGGRGAFKDPLGQNPLLEFARDYLPYGWKAKSKGTDRPLTYSDIEEFGRNFARFNYQGLCLVSTISTFLAGRGPSRLRRATDHVDTWILLKLPFLQRYCRYVATCVEK